MNAQGELDKVALDKLLRALTSPALSILVDPRLHGAACQGQAPLFDDRLDRGDHDPEPESERAERHHQARKICLTCPVRSACELAALDHESSGIWNGRLVSNHQPPRRKAKDAGTADPAKPVERVGPLSHDEHKRMTMHKSA
ncbi:WhiB family transcriptional regulator [Rhodococcus qingshengii]|nr:WhiB family transcriptional regulator [Rhodococcus qingshengii]